MRPTYGGLQIDNHILKELSVRVLDFRPSNNNEQGHLRISSTQQLCQMVHISFSSGSRGTQHSLLDILRRPIQLRAFTQRRVYSVRGTRASACSRRRSILGYESGRLHVGCSPSKDESVKAVSSCSSFGNAFVLSSALLLCLLPSAEASDG